MVRPHLRVRCPMPKINVYLPDELASAVRDAQVPVSAVCQAAVQVMEEGVTAAAVVHDLNGSLALRGHFGFGVHGRS